MKACPFCAEEIQDAAVKCKHCGESLAVRPTGLRAPIPPLQLLAAVVTLGGIGLAVWALQLDTSVATSAGRVHNLSLAAEKQNCLIAGGIATVIGVVLAGMSRPGLRAFVVAAILVAGGVSGLAKYAEYQAALRSDAAIRETEATSKHLRAGLRADGADGFTGAIP